MDTTVVAAGDRRTLYRVGDLVTRWSIGRSKIYELLDSGAIKSVKIGACRRVTATAVEEFEAILAQDGRI